MTRPLVSFRSPTPGDGRGVSNVLVGPDAPTPAGAPATVATIVDASATARTMLFAELAATAEARLADAGPATTPVWPLLTANVADGHVRWDGSTSVERARAVAVGDAVVSWVPDPGGLHVCVSSRRRDTTPNVLADALRGAGAVWGWADAAGHERRWLLANVHALAPHASPPANTGVDELRRGLAHISGFPTLGAMMGAGGYDPAPVVGNYGGVTFRRVRTLRQPERLAHGKLVHRLSPATGPGGLVSVLRSGVLLSQRRRRLLGLHRALGFSERADVESGISGYVFTELDQRDAPPPAVGLIWEDPSRLMQRLDFAVMPYAPTIQVHPAVSVPNPRFEVDTTGRTLDRDDAVVPTVAVADSVDLFGPHGPDGIVVRDELERAEVIADLRRMGVSALSWKQLDDAVHVNPLLAELASLSPMAR